MDKPKVVASIISNCQLAGLPVSVLFTLARRSPALFTRWKSTPSAVSSVVLADLDRQITRSIAALSAMQWDIRNYLVPQDGPPRLHDEPVEPQTGGERACG